MKNQSASILLLIAILSIIHDSSSFLIPSTHQPSTCLHAKKKGRQTNVPKPLPTGPPPQDINVPEGATMEQLLDALGSKRLKKIGRKNRRVRNQKIREGKVVLNELGEWVERD